MKKQQKAVLGHALKKSLPVMCGYLFLGFAFGILLQQAGYSALWAFFISLLVYAGSMQFVLVTLLSAGATLPTTAMMTLFINCRHMFYGLSFVEAFKKMGKKYLYMIFSLTDETYSLLCSCRQDAAENDEKHESWFWISLLDHSYWIIGSVAGALAGQMIPLDFTGIDFSMTALFTVILIDQIRGSGLEIRVPAMIGGIAAVVCLFIFGTDAFLLPALLLTVVGVAGLQAGSRKKKRADQKGPEAGTGEQV